MNNLDLDEIFKGLTAVYDEAGVIGEVPSKVGFAIVGIPEAKQDIQQLLNEAYKKGYIDGSINEVTK